jgi:hypothetical protein
MAALGFVLLNAEGRQQRVDTGKVTEGHGARKRETPV